MSVAAQILADLSADRARVGAASPANAPSIAEPIPEADGFGRDVLPCPVWALRGLPLPLTLHLLRNPPHAARAPAQKFVVTTAKASRDAALRRGDAVFTLTELEAATLGVQVERCWPGDLDSWLAAKRRSHSWTLTVADTRALDVRGVDASTPLTLTLGAVLDALCVELVRVES